LTEKNGTESIRFAIYGMVNDKKMKQEIEIYAEVCIADNTDNPEFQDKIGIVLGISWDEQTDEVSAYTVHFDDLPHVYSFSAKKVTPTG